MAENNRTAPIRRVMIVSKQHPRALSVARRIARVVERKRMVALHDPQTAKALGVKRSTRTSRSPIADLFVVVGGDGTLLSLARAIAAHPRPILGVNMGGLGFLTETGPDEVEETLKHVLEGNFTTESRMMLEVSLSRGRRTISRHRALNDVVINKSALARIIELGLKINRQFVNAYRADGLIVSTPTGSTAYSLAAGGPLIHPDMAALVISPICPHTLTLRPLVVPENSRVEITLRTEDSEVYLTIDGQVGHPLRAGDRVLIRRSDHPVLMVRSPHRNYYQLLRRKLRWGER
jgi:NAD+ kinase